MPKRKSFSRKAGLPPESLVFVGEKKLEQPRVHLYQYHQHDVSVAEITSVTQLAPPANDGTVTWLNVDGLHDTELIERVGELYGLHPLLLEDVLDTTHSPKSEVYEENIFMVMKMLSFEEASKGVITEQVSFVLGKNYLLTFQEGVMGDVFDTVRDRLNKGKGKARRLKADYLCYELLDAVIDNYFVVLERVGDKLELIEEEILAQQRNTILHEIHTLRGDLISLRKSIWPLRDIINQLIREDSQLVNRATKVYLKDLYDHAVQEIETIETYRDMLSGLQDLYLSSLSNKMNEVMKVLTIITTIFIPLSFIAGVYGMNFRYMPELESPLGYPAVLAAMLVIAVVMVVIFRRNKWM